MLLLVTAIVMGVQPELNANTIHFLSILQLKNVANAKVGANTYQVLIMHNSRGSYRYLFIRCLLMTVPSVF